MYRKEENNFAYIDGNNLYRGVKDFGWEIDFFRFRKWLADKYSVTKAYYFIGLIPKYKDLYKALQEAGFTLIFKEVVYSETKDAKGNCDTDLVLQSVRDYYEHKCEKQVIVTSDGDYAGLLKFLLEKDSLRSLLSPNGRKKCSILLKRTKAPIVFLDEVAGKISVNEKTPAKDAP